MATPNPPKPWKAEYAKSGRSSCKTCKSPIAKDHFRLAKMVASYNFDGIMPMWNHSDCIFRKADQIKSLDDVECLDLLRWEDQQKIKKYVETGPANKPTMPDSESEYAIEVSQTSRATCKRCNEKITKGTVRVSTKPEGQGPRGLFWNHVSCFIETWPSTDVEKISGWESLSPQEKVTVSSLVKKDISTSKGQTHNDAATKGTKRRKVGNDEKTSKLPKTEGVPLKG